MLKHKSVSSSANATTHGIFTSPVVLRNENNQEFLTLEREYTEHYSPLGPSERKLVEEMVVCEWRQRRVWAAETAGIDLQMDLDAPGLQKEFEQLDEPVRAAIAIKNLADNSSFLELMQRYETRFSRQYDRALRRLLDLQDRRNRQPEPPQRDNRILQNEKCDSELPQTTRDRQGAIGPDRKPEAARTLAPQPILQAQAPVKPVSGTPAATACRENR
jgi:hypothetical protein